uniref:Transmembrane protein C19orf77-like protein n=1 Tax=Callorhinchus milii TaxID=7868 RepID=V9LDB0_CALMI
MGRYVLQTVKRMAFTSPALLLLLLLGAAHAQSGGAKADTVAVWQPWLVGLTAVIVFIFIVFSMLILNRLLCKKKGELENVYEKYGNSNFGMSPEDEGMHSNKTTSL